MRDAIAHALGLLTIEPPTPEFPNWEDRRLPTSFVSRSGLETDILRSAAKAAENTGIPQRIVYLYGDQKTSVIRPSWKVRAALLGKTWHPSWEGA